MRDVEVGTEEDVVAPVPGKHFACCLSRPVNWYVLPRLLAHMQYQGSVLLTELDLLTSIEFSCPILCNQMHNWIEFG